MRAQLSNRDYEQLSAYLDGQLAPGDQRKLEERLRARPELQAALDELSRTRALIRMAPRRRAPRNFTLTPAMVGNTGPSRKRTRGGFFTLFPALSFASAVATILLVATLLFDLAPGRVTPTLETAMEPSTQSESGAPEMGAAEAQSPDAREMSPTAELKAAEPAGDAAQSAPFAAPESEAFSGGEAESLTPPGQPNGPVITWGSPGYGGGGEFGKGGGYDIDPGYATGMGGAPEGRGGGGGAPDGTIMVPPEGIASLETPESAVAEAPAQPPSTSSDSGPILGVPADEVAGQIIGQSSQGRPVPGVFEPSSRIEEQRQGQPANGELNTAGDQSQSIWDRRLMGLPYLRWAQILLVLVALSTALAAVLVRKKAR